MSYMGYKMTFPIITIRDKQSGRTHIVGTNSHDQLYVDKEGQLHYSNLQNGDGSGASDDYGYAFEGEEDGFSPCPIVKFATLDELLEIITEQAKLSAEHEREMRELMKVIWRPLEDEVKKSEDDGFMHT